MPVERLAEFVAWFDDDGRHAPGVAVPAAAARAERSRERPDLAAYPLTPGTTYVNVGFWGTVLLRPRGARRRPQPGGRGGGDRLGGHKSLYSDSFYDEATFASLYGTDHLDRCAQLDPEGRLPPLYDKAVRRR